MKYFENNSLAIGGTPLVLIRNLADDQATILAKIEGRNPAGSVKCRIASAMIRDAMKRGVLEKGMKIIEATSGNTGIALSSVGAAYGFAVTLTMPETMSLERRQIMKAFGATLILTEGSKGMPGAMKKARELIEENPKKYFMPEQFKNPANPAIHRQTTGPEIWEGTGGKVDVLVFGVGTGGTITGVSHFFKIDKKLPSIMTVAVEPENSPVISQQLAGKELKPGPHKIQGIGAGFIPDILDLSLIDRVEKASNEEAFAYALRLTKEEGIFAGISSGAAMAVAVRLAKSPEFKGKTIVTVLPDSGERYLSLLNANNA